MQLLSQEADLDDSVTNAQVYLHDVDLGADSFRSLSVEESVLERVVWTGGEARAATFTDMRLLAPVMAGLQLHGTGFRRIEIVGGTLDGASLTDCSLTDVTFRNTSLRGLNLRGATLTRVAFIDCRAHDLDAAGAQFTDVLFSRCELDGVDTNGLHCTRVDVSSSELGKINGISGLTGATISNTQLLQLAPVLASNLGIKIQD